MSAPPPQLPASMLDWHPHPDGSGVWLPPGLDIAGFTSLADARAASDRAVAIRDRMSAGVRQQVLLLNLLVGRRTGPGCLIMRRRLPVLRLTS